MYVPCVNRTSTQRSSPPMTGSLSGNHSCSINNHDPRHLRDEFDTDEPNSFGWEYVEQGPEVWRIRISKLTSTPLPRVLVNTADVIDDAHADGAAPQAMGAVWKLQTRDRDLDSNIIALPAGGAIDTHTGPDLDVLIHVLAGKGELATENGVVELLPRRVGVAPTSFAAPVHRRAERPAVLDDPPTPPIAHYRAPASGAGRLARDSSAHRRSQ